MIILFGWVVELVKIFPLLLVVLISCGSASEKYPDQGFEVNVRIIYFNNPDEECFKHLGPHPKDFKYTACFIEPNIIIAKEGDNCWIGHELCHAIFGDYDHQGECKL